MTDEQFEKLMLVVTQRQTDHDLLVEINTVVRLNHERYEAEKIDTGKKISLVERATEAAHKRLDFIYTGVMVSIGGIILTVITFFITHRG